MVLEHRRRIASAALVTLALWAGACGDDNSGTGGGSDGDKAAAAGRLLDIATTPRDQVKQGGTLRWPLDQFSTQWNYNQLDGTTNATNDVAGALMPYIYDYDEDASVRPDPNYLTSAEVSESGKQVVTLKINPKAKWSNDRAISWEDFETQWKALRSAENGFTISSSTGYERVGSVERGADDQEVVVTFDKPFGEWKSLFNPLYPKETQDTPEHFNKSYVNKIPITAGPFKLDKIDKSGQSLRIVPDAKWWGEPAKLDAIAYTSPEYDAQVNAFANGEVDRVNLPADASSYKRASGAAQGEVRTAGGPDFRHFTINATSPLLKDLQVRQALSQAINREAIAKSDLTGLNWPSEPMNNHFFVNTQEGYVDNSGEIGKFAPDAARAKLEAAGWKLDGTYRKKDGKTLKLRFVIPSGIAVSRQEGELTQAMLRDVGIQLEIRAVPSDDYFEKYVNIGNFDITPFSWIGTPFPISSAKSIYVGPTKDAKGELNIQQNYARVGSPEIDRLMREAEAQVDLQTARNLINQADKLIWKEVHSLIMFQRPQNVAVTKTLVNIGAFGFKSPSYEDMGFKK
ncbi:MAG TPA: ABC transporter family substrate-binding protein [Solirubrobacteraceae bacterium]|jgi:peptide/nickel transport system substrate-binding protein|nr:ABC transporter family substrate-binding protein [Solirubrobacteraceae bacterium]